MAGGGWRTAVISHVKLQLFQQAGLLRSHVDTLFMLDQGISNSIALKDKPGLEGSSKFQLLQSLIL